MNVKPGDRAIAINGPAQGTLCDVVYDGGNRIDLRDMSMCEGWICVFDRAVDWGSGTSASAPDKSEGWYPDKWLRPIRDQDGEDETLTWAGKPQSIKTPEAA